MQLAREGLAWSEGQQDDSEQGWWHLAEGLLQAVLGVGVLELDGADAAQVVQVAAQLLRTARHLRPLRLAAQLLRLRRNSPARLRCCTMLRCHSGMHNLLQVLAGHAPSLQVRPDLSLHICLGVARLQCSCRLVLLT